MIGAAALTWHDSIGQVSTAFNTGSTGDFVGWDGSMFNDPLDIKHEANQPIIWWTDNIERMILNQTTSYNI